MSTKDTAVKAALDDLRTGRTSEEDALNLTFETGRVSAVTEILQSDSVNTTAMTIALQAAMAVAAMEAKL
ncbi:MAG: hypothetical protein ACTIC1_05685 [Brevibacterium sp.]|uniref:hypothetical protein n=1 Tax=Brevibacterium aurantiacum TaxID=273384 RepID=UPI003F91E348